jgi:hypothetical protein
MLEKLAMKLFANTCATCGRRENSGENFIRVSDKYLCHEHAVEYIYSQIDLSAANKRSIIANLIISDAKYSRPFKTGTISGFNILGGDWNSFASLIVQLIIADTMLSIDRKLDQLTSKSRESGRPFDPGAVQFHAASEAQVKTQPFASEPGTPEEAPDSVKTQIPTLAPEEPLTSSGVPLHD